MLGDQPSAGIEDIHAVVDEPRSEYLVEYAQGVVDAQGIRGLAEPDPRDSEARPPLDEDNLHASPREVLTAAVERGPVEMFMPEVEGAGDSASLSIPDRLRALVEARLS